jgi:hypothetical protein
MKIDIAEFFMTYGWAILTIIIAIIAILVLSHIVKGDEINNVITGCMAYGCA